MVDLFLFHFRVTNSKLKKKKLHFELLTRWLNFYLYTFELLTRGEKIKHFTLSYYPWVHFYFLTFELPT